MIRLNNRKYRGVRCFCWLSFFFLSYRIYLFIFFENIIIIIIMWKWDEFLKFLPRLWWLRVERISNIARALFSRQISFNVEIILFPRSKNCHRYRGVKRKCEALIIGVNCPSNLIARRQQLFRMASKGVDFRCTGRASDKANESHFHPKFNVPCKNLNAMKA